MQNSLARDIFGDSDSELEDLPDTVLPPADATDTINHQEEEEEDDDDDEEEPLPSFKKRTDVDFVPSAAAEEKAKKLKSKKKKKRRDQEVAEKSEVPEKDLTPQERLIREANKDIDDVLARMKTRKPAGGKSGDLDDEVVKDAEAAKLVNEMSEAANADAIANRAGKPAFSKLAMLQDTKERLKAAGPWIHSFIDAGIMSCFRLWLEPLSDASLPSLDIQVFIMDFLDGMPVETQHLRTSQVGKIVMFYTKCPRVTPAVKKAALLLTRKWMRPILRKSANYKDAAVRTERVERSQNPKPNKALLEASADSQRARIPQRVLPAFSIAPQSMMQGGSDKKTAKFKRLKTTISQMRVKK